MVFSVWTTIVMKTSFQGLPEGLVEAGLIDGASYGRIFFQAYVVVTTVPIILVYPFVQRFFIKGVLVGSIKE